MEGGSPVVVSVFGAEFETTRKMGSENERENDDFCKSEGRLRFFNNDSFSVHFELHFSKMRLQNGIKMSQKWPENGYCEQPYS